MDAFAAAAAAMFRDRNMTELLRWWPEGAVQPVELRGIVSTPDESVDFNGARISAASMVVDLRKVDADYPREQQMIEARGQLWRVLGEPQLDTHGLFWRVELVPK